MGDGRHGLTIEVYRKNPKTGTESEHTRQFVEAEEPLIPGRVLPRCECGDPACIARGGRP
jgi:hypothetical protein